MNSPTPLARYASGGAKSEKRARAWRECGGKRDSPRKRASGRPLLARGQHGRLAESFGIVQALKYHGRIKDELEWVLTIDTKAENLLRRVIDAPFDAEWAPEESELKQRSAVLLKKMGA